MSAKILQTPSQTVGPYFAYGLTPKQYGYDFKNLTTNILESVPEGKEIIIIKGKIFDGENKVIPDAMIELWQNDGEHNFFGRFGTGSESDSHFTFQTIKPNSVDGQAPFVTLIVFMRGQLIHSYTRIYFSDETELNKQDVVLNSVPAERQHTIIAQKKGSRYEFNIYMQGENETVFFEV